jgi:Ca2+/Na+ antiporter
VIPPALSPLLRHSSFVTPPSYPSFVSNSQLTPPRSHSFPPKPFVVRYTVVDSKVKPKLYMATFAACCCWLGVFVFYMIQWAEKVGCMIGISPAVMGLTVCAAGTSAPEAFSSFEMARKGRGSMAVFNVFGSNIFGRGYVLLLSYCYSYCYSHSTRTATHTATSTAARTATHTATRTATHTATRTLLILPRILY